MTENEFKFRFNNHKTSFKHKKHATKTALSKYIWDLKEKLCAYSINLSILKHTKPCNSGSNNCNLCTTEKLCILNADKRFLLNKRSELISQCRYDNKFYVNSLRFQVSQGNKFQSDDRLERETRVNVFNVFTVIDLF